MWNNHGQYWPEDQSWLNASPFGQYSPSGSVQPSWLSQTHPPVSTRTVSPVQESRSNNPASFCSEGSVSVGSDDGVSNHLAVNSVNANRRKQWSKEQVLALLGLYQKRRNDFKDPKKRNKDVWEAIGKGMEELGFPDKRILKVSSKTSKGHTSVQLIIITPLEMTAKLVHTSMK